MRFLTFIETCFLMIAFSVICLAGDTAFISMAGDCRHPAVSAEGNSIFITWIVAEGRNAKIFFKRSMDEGQQWSNAQKICNDNGDCFPPAIAVNSGIVHVAWVDYGETVDGELYYARSQNKGEAWDKNRILVTDCNSARYPLIACKDKNVYLIWQDVENKVYFKASHDQGLTWETEILLGRVGKHSCYCYPPAISCNGNELVVVWTDFREDKRGINVLAYGFPLAKTSDKMVSSVVCRTSSDNGRTWNKEQVLTSTRLSKEMGDEIDNPVMLSDGSLSYLFWLDRRNVKLGEIYYARFDPRKGKGPVAGKNLYPAQKRSPKRPSVVFDKEKNLRLTWASYFGGESTVCYGRIDPAGNILAETKELTGDTGRYHDPIITRMPSGLLHVFWFDEPKDEYSKIFLKTSRDDGLTWQLWGSQKKDM
jgi:hypothetical protein